MFRAAFPTAPEDAEKVEANWVKANFDSKGANGHSNDPNKPPLRLAGTWVTTEVALAVAEAYNLEHIVRPLAEAQPDPDQEYRRSTKPNATDTPVSTPMAKKPTHEPVVVPPTPPAQDAPTTKRRRGMRDSSPIQAQAAQTELLIAPRRGARGSSPALSNRGSPAKGRKKPISGRQSEQPKTVVNEDDEPQPDTHPQSDPDYVDVPGPDMHADVEEQRAMIFKLKAERDQANSEHASGSSENATKRPREDEPPKFNFKEESSSAAGEDAEMAVARPIATNRRVELAPQQKSAAWGVLLFAAGLAAAYVATSLAICFRCTDNFPLCVIELQYLHF
jgi:hypothetical protein